MKNSKLDELASLILEEINTSVEMDEMANFVYDREELAEPMRIPIAQVQNIPPGTQIKCKDKEGTEFNTDEIVGNSVITLPNGLKFLEFHNYGEPYKNRPQSYTTRYYGLNGKYEGRYKGALPTERNRIDWENPPEFTSSEEEENWYKEKEKWNEAYAKRYAIFRAIDKFFERQDILDRLDSALIPETPANPRHTERTTRVEKTMTFGGKDMSIMCTFHAVRDFQDPQEAMDHMFNTRVAIEDGIARERKSAEAMPRQFVSKGLWDYLQRIGDENDFNTAGKYTPILDLFRKNIQEGQKSITIMSLLQLDGKIEGTEYVLKGTFTSKLGYRIPQVQERARNIGNLIEPIEKVVRKPIPRQAVNNPNFTIRKYPEFFFGKVDGSGILSELMNEIGEEMRVAIQPEEVLNKITGLLEFKPADMNESKKKRTMGKKIKITEEQLKKVVNVVKEQQFDDAITKYQKEKEREIYMSRDEAEAIINLATNWCQGKEGSPDCNEVLRLRSKFNLD